MLFDLESEKNSKIVTNIILAIICCFVIGSSTMVYFINKINIPGLVKLIDFNAINYTLAIISIPAFIIYYYLNQEKNFFILTLVHTSFVIDEIYYLFINHLFDNEVIKNIEIFMFTYIFRIILLILILCKKNKVKDMVINNKVIATTITILITLIFATFELKLSMLPLSNMAFKIVNTLMIITILFGLIIISLISFKAYKNNKFIYMIIISSMYLFFIERIARINSISADGANLYILSNMINSIGYCMILVALFFQITNKVKENESLKNNLNIFYNLTENNPYNYVVINDNSGRIIYANDICRRMYCNDSKSLNKEQYENLNKAIKSNIDDEYREEIIKTLMKDKIYKGIIFTNKGEVIKLKIQSVVIDNKELVVTSFKYITDDYKANESLKINESKLRSITENIKELIFVLDCEGKIDYVNKNAINVLGYGENELIGSYYKKNFELIDIDKYINSKENKIVFIDTTILRKDGSVLNVESVLSEIRNDGKLMGYIITSRDVGYKKQMEHLTNKYNEIKEYEKIRNEFFANLSHEVRTPINIIYSCIQLLNNEKKKGDEELLKYYDKYELTIKQNCFRMLRLVNNLIDITKIDAGFMKMNFCNYDIIRLIEEIILSVVPYVEEKKINIIFDTEIEELEIKCDPDKIERIILNLISNAVKFTDIKGSILVYIGLQKDWIEIKIKDNGIGIPKELRKLIFERFIQVDKSFNRCKEGSGIGLALVKSLVELHDGQVYLNDEVNVGSEFIVKLPIVKLDVENIKDKNLGQNEDKSMAEKISVEFSDIYDIY